MQTSTFTTGTSLRAPQRVARVAARRSVVVRADFIGSSTNQIMVLSTFLPIAAARFGLAPSSFKGTGPKAGLKLYDRSAGLATNDPAGLTATDVLALGALGHAIGVGIVLGLKATGTIA